MDVEDTVVVEEGEVSDDSDGYTPLERPSNYAASILPAATQKVAESESDELQSSSKSDSDSDSQSYRAKKPKVKLKRPKLKADRKRKKYDIWSNHVHEDLLSETLNSCDVTFRDRSRDVESYDYTLAIPTEFKRENEPRTSNKRSLGDRKNQDLRLVLKNRDKKDEQVKGSVRIILDMNASSDSTVEEFAQEMANKLFEEKQDLFVRIVSAAGKEKALEIFNEVKRIEADGGMLIMNQSRRRTPGGIFLFLLKHDGDLTKEQFDVIFEDEKQLFKEQVKKKKKKKIKEMKAKIAAKKSENLPELLKRAEVVQKLNKNSWSPKETSQEDVVNPPPTPETDGHADSGDNMENNTDGTETRKHEPYNDDVLDLYENNEMDMF